MVHLTGSCFSSLPVWSCSCTGDEFSNSPISFWGVAGSFAPNFKTPTKKNLSTGDIWTFHGEKIQYNFCYGSESWTWPSPWKQINGPSDRLRKVSHCGCWQMSQKWGAGSRIGRTNSRLYYRGHLSECWLILMLLHLPVAGFQRWGFRNSCIFEMVNDHTGAGHCSYLKIACSEQKTVKLLEAEKVKKLPGWVKKHTNTFIMLVSSWISTISGNQLPLPFVTFFSRCFVGEAPSTVPGCRLSKDPQASKIFPNFPSLHLRVFQPEAMGDT